MGLINLLIKDPLTFVLIAVPLLYSVILHELAHGWVAYRMGDPTAKMMGRLSLNPLRHLDPVGTLMLFFVGFGWARPVPVNFANLRGGRRELILVSSAGIIVNTILAFLSILLLRLLASPEQSVTGTALYYMAHINIILAAFNLIPIPPLDGSKILMGFLPVRLQDPLLRLEPYGFFIIIGLLFFGILNPVIDFFKWIILSIIGILLF
ncbi:MAG: site-2 protease family protein [Syntrophobacterales bacterium]|nr:MAG: site-2 protease family protein [Syntrophobacterales bacterium]